MRIYSRARSVPDGAKKAIKGGAYGAAGLTDVNTQFRIERATELFGPIGDGWMYEVVEFWENYTCCFAHVVVKYRLANGEWSSPIHGYGGTKIGGKDDSDIYKSTVTDAFGNALKYLGIGGDVVYKPDNTSEENQFDSKYSAPPEINNKTQRQQSRPASQDQPDTQQQDNPSAPPQQQSAPRMAAPGQKKFITENATVEEYEATTKAYGKELEKLTYAVAEKLVAKIQRRMNNAD